MTDEQNSSEPVHLNQADLILMNLIEYMEGNSEEAAQLMAGVIMICAKKGVQLNPLSGASIVYNAINYKMAREYEVNHIGEFKMDDPQFLKECEDIRTGEFRDKLLLFINTLIPSALIQLSVQPKTR